jgi:hypothetical protein
MDHRTIAAWLQGTRCRDLSLGDSSRAGAAPGSGVRGSGVVGVNGVGGCEGGGGDGDGVPLAEGTTDIAEIREMRDSVVATWRWFFLGGVVVKCFYLISKNDVK